MELWASKPSVFEGRAVDELPQRGALVEGAQARTHWCALLQWRGAEVCLGLEVVEAGAAGAAAASPAR